MFNSNLIKNKNKVRARVRVRDSNKTRVRDSNDTLITKVQKSKVLSSNSNRDNRDNKYEMEKPQSPKSKKISTRKKQSKKLNPTNPKTRPKKPKSQSRPQRSVSWIQKIKPSYPSKETQQFIWMLLTVLFLGLSIIFRPRLDFQFEREIRDPVSNEVLVYIRRGGGIIWYEDFSIIESILTQAKMGLELDLVKTLYRCGSACTEGDVLK